MLQCHKGVVELHDASLETFPVVVLAERNHARPVAELRREQPLAPSHVHDVLGIARPAEIRRKDERAAKGPEKRQQEQQPDLLREGRLHRELEHRRERIMAGGTNLLFDEATKRKRDQRHGDEIRRMTRERRGRMGESAALRWGPGVFQLTALREGLKR